MNNTTGLLIKNILTNNLIACDPQIEDYLKILSEHGADLCWHKHSTFKQHLFQVWKILTIWEQPRHIARCGLFHSAYSNSYVNLAIFNANEDRSRLKQLIGDQAEEWAYLFCTINRYDVVYNHLLMADKVPDSLVVKHIKTGADIELSKSQLGQILVLTIADFSDQLFSFQDKLFEHNDGKLLWKGNNPNTLWPGDCKPGLWMSCMSRVGLLAKQCEATGVRLPGIFGSCTKFLSEGDELIARDKYWDVVMNKSEAASRTEAEQLLLDAIKHNPFVAEPHVVLAQILNIQHRWEEALQHATQGIILLEQWGTCWDKRMPWEGWIAWTRQLAQGARYKTWPDNAWGIINLGLVKE